MTDTQKIKNKTPPKTEKKISLSEFKYWLAGLSEGQPRNWSPNKQQWKLIQSKIKLIDETATEQPVFRPVHNAGNNRSQFPFPPPPPVSGGVPEGVVIPSSTQLTLPQHPTGSPSGAGASAPALLNHPPTDASAGNSPFV